jgi:hypothetical protein
MKRLSFGEMILGFKEKRNVLFENLAELLNIQGVIQGFLLTDLINYL